jgi:hypothetical protein
MPDTGPNEATTTLVGVARDVTDSDFPVVQPWV